MAIINTVISGGGGSAPQYYVPMSIGQDGLEKGPEIIDLTGVSDIASNALKDMYFYHQFPANTTIDLKMGAMTNSGCCEHMFYGASGITEVTFSGLGEIGGSAPCDGMFAQSSITRANFPNLTTVGGDGPMYLFFDSCPNLEYVYFEALESIGDSLSDLCTNCPKLKGIYFDSLNSNSFDGGTSVLENMLDATTGSTATGGCTIHFPSNFDPSDPDHTFDASTLDGYPTFGGSASYIHVVFDLEATE